MADDPALLVWLKREKPEYHAKARELRSEVERWLNYVPQTFPHFTSHTIDHSDEIVRQLSQFLFLGSQKRPRPVLKDFSATEAYVLIASAYLHDAGMVVSQADKERLVQSEEWRAWVAPGAAGEARWLAVQQQLQQAETNVAQVLAAGAQLRYLIAEFFRAQHHLRVRQVIELNANALGRFDFGDHQLRAAISAVCVGHGLSHDELLDVNKYPEERNIRNDRVNLQFCAIALRLGDLLDLRTNRACPLLLSAAAPMPAGSEPHWSQYSRIGHMVTAPDRIEIWAECQSAEEFAVLKDWCGWIVEECEFAETCRSRWLRRFGTWEPPRAKMTGPDPTIKIRFQGGDEEEWRIEVDPREAIERFVQSDPRDPSFIRELLQNAVDATRCRIYRDLQRSGRPLPSRVTDVPADRLSQYAIEIGVEVGEDKRGRPEAAGSEPGVVVTVADPGIGMTRSIVRNYLLQVGKSWYTTQEFARTFPFVPTSQFGVGFLTVFGVSNDIEVQTRAESGDEPIGLKLCGPRNYIIFEKGHRETIGTTVTVRLRPGALQRMAVEDIARYVGWLCRRVEVPIRLTVNGAVHILEAERPSAFESRSDDPDRPNAEFVVKAVPIDTGEWQGEYYVFAEVIDGVENWDWGYAWILGLQRDRPNVRLPEIPMRLEALHGLTLHERQPIDLIDRVRIDYRGRRSAVADWKRASWQTGIRQPPREAIGALIERHLEERDRVASEDDGWRYRNRLAWVSEELGLEFWSKIGGLVPVHGGGRAGAISLREWAEIEDVWLVRRTALGERPEAWREVAADDSLVLDLAETEKCARLVWRALLRNRSLSAVKAVRGWVGTRWTRSDKAGSLIRAKDDGGAVTLPTLVESVHCRDLELPKLVVLRLRSRDYFSILAWNEGHPLGRWGKRISLLSAAELGATGIPSVAATGVIEAFLNGSAAEVQRRLAAWRRIAGLPQDLQPPECGCSDDDLSVEVALGIAPPRRLPTSE